MIKYYIIEEGEFLLSNIAQTKEEAERKAWALADKMPGSVFVVAEPTISVVSEISVDKNFTVALAYE